MRGTDREPEAKVRKGVAPIGELAEAGERPVGRPVREQQQESPRGAEVQRRVALVSVRRSSLLSCLLVCPWQQHVVVVGNNNTRTTTKPRSSKPIQCRHSVRPRPARPMPTAPPCIRQRPACRMSTSRGSGNGFAAAQAQQSHQQQSASTGTASKQTAALGRPSALSVLQHVL